MLMIRSAGGINLYGFVWNNPVDAFDADGREAGFTYRPDGRMENFVSRQSNPPKDPVAAASDWVGFSDYDALNPFEEPKWFLKTKCNKYVGDCISECPKRPKPLIKDPVSGKMRYPLAREWDSAFVKIPGFETNLPPELKEFIKGRYYYCANKIPKSWLGSPYDYGPVSTNLWNLTAEKGPTSAQEEYRKFRERGVPLRPP